MIWDEEEEKVFSCNGCSKTLGLDDTIRYSGKVLCKKCFVEGYPHLKKIAKKL